MRLKVIVAIIFPLELFIYFWSIIFRLEICLKENMCGESGGDEIWKYVCLDVTFWGDSLRQGDRIIAGLYPARLKLRTNVNPCLSRIMFINCCHS